MRWSALARNLLLCLLFPQQAQGFVSYVLESFDRIHSDWLVGASGEEVDYNITLAQGGGVEVEYKVGKTATWGGNMYIAAVVPDDRSHNCHGASHVRLRLKIVESKSETANAHFRVVIFDDSHCGVDENGVWCPDGLENYYSFHHILSNVGDDWVDLDIPLEGSGEQGEPFWRTGWVGSVGNDELDSDRLSGFRLEWVVGAQAITAVEGTMMLDRLECIGGGDLFGAAFFSANDERNETFVDALQESFWYLVEPVDEEEASVELGDGTLTAFVNATSPVVLQHVAAYRGFYDLSRAAGISLDFEIDDAQPGTSQPSITISLYDGRACVDCDMYPASNQFMEYQVTIDTSQEPFGNWSASWEDFTPVPMDLGVIKGFQIQVSTEEDATTTVHLHNLGVLTSNDVISGDDSIVEYSCTPEPLLYLHTGGVDLTHRNTFRQCCEACENDPDCHFATMFGEHCGLLPSVTPFHIDLISTGWERSERESSVCHAGRGNFCDKCKCDNSTRSIDCRGRELVTVPSEWSESWMPTSLDLRGNQDLVIVPSDAFDAIAVDLQQLYLPKELRYLAEKSLDRLPPEATVEMEIGHYWGITNAILHPDGLFSETCCSRGSTKFGFTFCEMEITQPGSDSFHDPFLFPEGGPSVIERLKPSSFMFGEAAESLDKCAEYCESRN